MNRIGVLVLSVSACLPLAAQSGSCCREAEASAPVAPHAATGKLVEFSGIIEQIHIVPGQGMPYLAVKRGADIIRVYLGPMPFLLAENFNPKAGHTVIVKGYQTADWLLAAQIQLVAEKRTVKFRDEHGWPLWRGGFGRRSAP
jgi:hypothetical protein